jgi:hypothetical protein
LLGTTGYILSVGDSRRQRTESVPAGKGRRAVSVPRGFIGHNSSSSRSREGGVDRGFYPDNSGKGEGEIGRFTGDRGRAVNAMVEEEGEDWGDRNKRIR